MEIPAQSHILETGSWLVNHRMDSALPGYLMVGSKRLADELSELPASALPELGPRYWQGSRTLCTGFCRRSVSISADMDTPRAIGSIST
ncbi:diadenosine tetraphosphate (Ap4A) HIT family hydrolase [Rhizobium mongolense]